jgi:hypothetical protein
MTTVSETTIYHNRAISYVICTGIVSPRFQGTQNVFPAAHMPVLPDAIEHPWLPSLTPFGIWHTLAPPNSGMPRMRL